MIDVVPTPRHCGHLVSLGIHRIDYPQVRPNWHRHHLGRIVFRRSSIELWAVLLTVLGISLIGGLAILLLVLRHFCKPNSAILDIPLLVIICSVARMLLSESGSFDREARRIFLPKNLSLRVYRFPVGSGMIFDGIFNFLGISGIVARRTGSLAFSTVNIASVFRPGMHSKGRYWFRYIAATASLFGV